MILYYHAAQSNQSRIFATWLMLTTKAVTKYFPESEEQQCRLWVQSTKEQDKNTHINTVNSPQTRTRDICIKIKNIKQLMNIDQRGKFPIKSNQGNRYIMVLCKIDGKLIMVKPMKYRTSGKMCKAYGRLMQHCKAVA